MSKKPDNKNPISHEQKSPLHLNSLLILLGILMALAVLRLAFFGHVSEEKHLLVELTLLLLIAVVAENVVQHSKQPFVMVLLLLGVIVSPYTLQALWPPIANLIYPLVHPLGFNPNPSSIPNIVTDGKIVQSFAQLGAILLLFRIGLHSKIESVFNVKNFAIAAGGVILPFILGAAFAFYSGGNFTYALFLGAALAATSVGITVAVLEEMKALSKPFAQAILGAAVIDDILALVVLGLVKSVPSEFSAAALAPFAYVLIVALLFVICGISLGRAFVEKFFKEDETELSKRTLAGLLAVAFFYAFAAEALGMSAIVGAFLAGIVIAYSPIAEKLNRSLFPLDVIFTPIFFISLGLMVDVFAIPSLLLPLIAICALAIIGKIIGCGLAAKFFGFGNGDSLTIGVGMIPRGEIALIVALIGTTTIVSGAPAISTEQYSLIASMAFITTVIVPPLLSRAASGADSP